MEKEGFVHRRGITHIFSLTLLLGGLWLGLSGHFDPLLLSLGAVSVCLTVFLAHRMEVIDHESHPVHLTIRLVRFWAYLVRKIVEANIDVAGRILKPGKTIAPAMVEVPLPQRTSLGKVIYANSITLTPGTVSVSLEKESVIVHALTPEAAEDLARGEMASSVPEDVKRDGWEVDG
jgi:multicomponent Na+:H+ antiporter subunit E